MTGFYNYVQVMLQEDVFTPTDLNSEFFFLPLVFLRTVTVTFSTHSNRYFFYTR